MIESAHGNFKIIKEHREALDIKTFNDRYVDYLDKYLYIVGDISAGLLRLKGFTQETRKMIDDYLMESTTLNAPYFILERLDGIKNSTE